MSTLRAKDSFTAFVGGQAINVRAGDLLDSGHVTVKGREKLFESVEDYVENPGRKTSVTRGQESPSHVLMERTSAEPGERRSVDTKTGVKAEKNDEKVDEKKVEDKSSARRSPVKMDTSAGPKGKQDGEV